MSATEYDVMQEAEGIRRKRLEALGLSNQYDLWRESMPDERGISDQEAYEAFLSAQDIESAALDGRVSVATGATDITADTDIPTPGPDGEGPGTDAPGDTSEGAPDGAPPGDLSKLILGAETGKEMVMPERYWRPPEEAEAKNYIEPTTDSMTRTPEWVDEAKRLYEFMGSPDLVPGGPSPGLVEERAEYVREYRERMGLPEGSDEEIGQWARNQMSMFNWNVMMTLSYAQKIMSSGDPDMALTFLNLLNMYDHSDGGALEFGKALLNVASDPTTYVGLGFGSIAARGAAKATAKAGLKKAIQLAIVGGTAGAFEGGTLAGGFNLTVQNIEQEAGVREDISYGEAGLATGIGIAAGTALGAGGGHLVGRRVDKLAAASEKELARILGGQRLEAERIEQELPIDQMVELLEASQKASEEAGRRDEPAAIAVKYLQDVDELPRKADGTIDEDAIARELQRVQRETVAGEIPEGGIDVGKYRASAEELADPNVFHQSGKPGRYELFDQQGKLWSTWDDLAEAEGAYNALAKAEAGGKPTLVDTTDVLPERRGTILDAPEGEKILPGRRGDRPLTVKEGLARGLDDAEIAKLEQHPLNVAEKLERAGFKVVLGEEGDIAFDIAGMPGADAERIGRIAAETNVKAEPFGTAEGKGYVAIQGEPENIAKFADAVVESLTPARLPGAESLLLAKRITEMQATAQAEVVAKTASLPGSRVKDPAGREFEVMGRTKNGWYHLRDKITGEEINKRRNQFEVIESRPKPRFAGPMELAPFTKSAARIMAMNEDVVSGKLEHVKITTAEQRTIVKELREMGIDITEKKLATYWTPAELLFLRDTYNAQARGIADLARILQTELKNNGRLSDSSLAMFNEAHTQFVATRDLFYGVSGNAARQLQILKTRPTDEVYEFTQSLMDSISIQGGRANTERAITMMAEFSMKKNKKPGQSTTGAITSMSESIWGNQIAAAILNVRYNMMLSSWRTHFFNFLGNSASGIYQHLMISPVKMGINNMAYARDIARSVINPKWAPDPADRITRHQWYAELRGHYSGFRDSLALAKEIAMGRDIGEGKVWNELGLRYNVVNVPTTGFGKIGTTPVRLLEAGDAFFKNQYYMSKIHELSSIKARADEIIRGQDYKVRYRHYVDNPDAPMQRVAKDFAAKQTYTNDPSVYGGVLAALARGVATAQNRSLAVNMIVPFVRTPANLLSYSMEMIGANVALSPNKTYNAIMKGTAAESQEALARLTVAAGLWLTVYEMYQNGDITGTGPSNWEERKVWEAAGWQANSVKVHGKWYGIARADPAGQSLVTIASVFDYYAMTQQQQKPAMEWIGAGLLYTADMIVDESYLSTASDVITAIQSKQESKARSVTASLINSMVVPNLLRDFRRPTDETKRAATSTNLLDQVEKHMKNASPWLSEDLPPQRDWKGDPVNMYGNAYTRGLIPFDIRNPEDSDPASMALAYARIPVSVPNKTIDWPGGQGDSIDLFAMDKGAGFVYDKYVEIMGKMRGKAVNMAMKTSIWKRMVSLDNNGPGSDGEDVLRKALGIGSRLGRLQMLDFLIKHSGDNNTFRRGNGDLIIIHHPVSVQEYIRIRRMVRSENIRVPEEFEQYQIQERQTGPEFFKPRSPE